MSDINYTTLAKCLLRVPDARSRRGQRYEWQFLLLVATSAVMIGQKSVRAMAQLLMNNREKLLARCGVASPADSQLRSLARRADFAIAAPLAEAAGGLPPNDKFQPLAS